MGGERERVLGFIVGDGPGDDGWKNEKGARLRVNPRGFNISK